MQCAIIDVASLYADGSSDDRASDMLAPSERGARVDKVTLNRGWHF